MNTATVASKVPSVYLEILATKREPILYDEADWFVIFANRPCNEGHLLLIPKIEEREFYKLPPDILQRGFEISTKLSLLLSEIYHPPRVALFIKGFTNDNHVHMHITPAYQSSDLDVNPSRHQLTQEEMFLLADKLAPFIENRLTTH